MSVQRAYADWRRYPQYIVPLSEASIDLIFAPAFGANKKNATDIRLAIDALELVFTRPEIGLFILLSGDSDFSALVLKLKEYGKYVIGVGLRESSSDLLIQNCDEYYSYSELTGLTKSSDVEHVQRDPWELVVEAVQRMREGGDVMRSDRLKQVMLSIDPSFAEKEAGFNRFSKFVLEASRRGLLTITKLENGQHEVDVGPNANVLPAVAEAPAVPAHKKSPARSRRRRSPRRGSDDSSALTLTDTFELLRDALVKIGAVGEQSTDAEQVCETMAEMAGESAEAALDAKRFPRVLRQAHDAGLIELVKGDDDQYLLKLAPGAADEAEPVTADPGSEPAPKKRTKRATPRRSKSRARKADTNGSDEAEPPDDDKTPPKRTRRKRKTTRGTKDESIQNEKTEPTSEQEDLPSRPVAETPRRRTGPGARRGSKGHRGDSASPTRPREVSEAPDAPPVDRVVSQSSHRVSLGARRGSKGGRPHEDRPPSRPAAAESIGGAPQPADAGESAESSPDVPPPRGSL